jgi:transcriptional regulator GlxA family with amidase domain
MDEEQGPYRVGFLLIPDFALLPFASATDPLRVANWLSGRELYTWTFLSETGQEVQSSSGVPVRPHGSIDAAADFDMVLVLAGGRDAAAVGSKKIFSWLRGCARRRIRLGALGLGSYVLARAGLLDGYRCTVHWQSLAGFRQAFPHLSAIDEIYEIDRDRYTCCGGTSVLDMMLAIIGEQHGHDLSTRVAEEFIHERIRTSDDDQRMPLRLRLDAANPRLLEAVAIMEDNIEQPLSCADIADQVGLSVRQLEKMFRCHLNTAPSRYYIGLRLIHARKLLQQTTMPVLEVGLATGFASASHFSKAYRAQFGRTPRLERSRRRPVPNGPLRAERHAA